MRGVKGGNALIPTDECHSTCQKILRMFMERDTSFACSQQPNTSIYPEPD